MAPTAVAALALLALLSLASAKCADCPAYHKCVLGSKCVPTTSCYGVFCLPGDKCVSGVCKPIEPKKCSVLYCAEYGSDSPCLGAGGATTCGAWAKDTDLKCDKWCPDECFVKRPLDNKDKAYCNICALHVASCESYFDIYGPYWAPYCRRTFGDGCYLGDDGLCVCGPSSGVEASPEPQALPF